MPTFCASSPIQKGSSFCPRLVLSLIFPSNRSYFPTSLSFPSRFSRCSLPKGVVLVVLRVYPIPSLYLYPQSQHSQIDSTQDPHIQSHQHIFCYCLDGTRGAGPQTSCFFFTMGSSLFSKSKISRLEVLEYLSRKMYKNQMEWSCYVISLKMVCQTVKCCKCSQVQTCLDRCVQRRQEKHRAEHPAKFMCFSIQT